jgi:hypothetical protein
MAGRPGVDDPGHSGRMENLKMTSLWHSTRKSGQKPFSDCELQKPCDKKQ